MEIKQGRMVHLGYGKFWRSDEIVGLCPVEEERGPGRRTEVFVETLEEPIVASRSERSILRDVVTIPEDIFRAEEARRLLEDLREDLSELTPIVRRMLLREAGFDVGAWERRLSAALWSDAPAAEEQDLFSEPA